MCTSAARNMHRRCTKYAPPVHEMCPGCAPPVHSMCTAGALNVHRRCTNCALPVHEKCTAVARRRTKRTMPVHETYNGSVYKQRIVPQRCRKYAPLLHNCLIVVHNKYTASVFVVHLNLRGSSFSLEFSHIHPPVQLSTVSRSWMFITLTSNFSGIISLYWYVFSLS